MPELNKKLALAPNEPELLNWICLSDPETPPLEYAAFKAVVHPEPRLAPSAVDQFVPKAIFERAKAVPLQLELLIEFKVASEPSPKLVLAVDAFAKSDRLFDT